jgi:hypothetical protein
LSVDDLEREASPFEAAAWIAWIDDALPDDQPSSGRFPALRPLAEHRGGESAIVVRGDKEEADLLIAVSSRAGSKSASTPGSPPAA